MQLSEQTPDLTGQFSDSAHLSETDSVTSKFLQEMDLIFVWCIYSAFMTPKIPRGMVTVCGKGECVCIGEDRVICEPSPGFETEKKCLSHLSGKFGMDVLRDPRGEAKKYFDAQNSASPPYPEADYEDGVAPVDKPESISEGADNNKQQQEVEKEVVVENKEQRNGERGEVQKKKKERARQQQQRHQSPKYEELAPPRKPEDEHAGTFHFFLPFQIIQMLTASGTSKAEWVLTGVGLAGTVAVLFGGALLVTKKCQKRKESNKREKRNEFKMVPTFGGSGATTQHRRASYASGRNYGFDNPLYGSREREEEEYMYPINRATMDSFKASAYKEGRQDERVCVERTLQDAFGGRQRARASVRRSGQPRALEGPEGLQAIPFDVIVDVRPHRAGQRNPDDELPLPPAPQIFTDILI